MNDLHTFAVTCGFPLSEIIADGKVHRFKVDSKDSKESGYYVFHQNYSNISGQQFYAGLIGSWKTGEEHTFQSAVKMSKQDRDLARKQMQEAAKRAEAKKLEEQEKTAEEVQAKWAKLAPTGLSDYHRKKGLIDLHGARTSASMFGTEGYVPLVDVEGKLWNLQKLQPDGGKFFELHGRVTGCFHVIGSLDGEDTVYLAEGFATAGSIYAAIGKPVVTAFNSGNLIPVARELKGKYPDKTYIVCGDEDKWTTRPDGTVWNPGREAAEEAAKVALGSVVFPVFKNLESKPTDFNDLMQLEGLDAIREQILPVKTEKQYVIALGYDGDSYFLLSNQNPQIQRLSSSQMSSSGLLRLQSLAYWETLFPSKQSGVAWTEAGADLMQKCHANGIFKSDRVRGRGVWLDGGRVVYHRGSNLVVNGEEIPLHRNGMRSRYIYELASELPPLHPEPLTVAECEALINASCSIRWSRADSFQYYAGWLAVSMVGGALSWRPHIWLTGASGSGKSWIMQHITHPLLSDHSEYFRGQTTEAGIRQRMGSSTLPVIFDEFETNDEHSAIRIRSILELARQASSESSGVVAKGTPGGTSLEFRPQFCMSVGSVRLQLVHEEDENRFTVLELGRAQTGEEEQWARLQRYVANIGPDYGRRLFSRMVNRAAELRQTIDLLQTAIKAQKHPIRVAQQYGALMGGYWMLQHDNAPTVTQAASMALAFNESIKSEASERSDEEECLHHLLQRSVNVTNGDGRRDEFSIAQLVQIAAAPNAPELMVLELERYGIHVGKTDGKLCMSVDPKHRAIAAAYRDSRWTGNFENQLARVKGAMKNKNVRFKIFGQKKAVCLPISVVFPSDHQ